MCVNRNMDRIALLRDQAEKFWKLAAAFKDEAQKRQAIEAAIRCEMLALDLQDRQAALDQRKAERG